jgi:hypothetical protein
VSGGSQRVATSNSRRASPAGRPSSPVAAASGSATTYRCSSAAAANHRRAPGGKKPEPARRRSRKAVLGQLGRNAYREPGGRATGRSERGRIVESDDQDSQEAWSLIRWSAGPHCVKDVFRSQSGLNGGRPVPDTSRGARFEGLACDIPTYQHNTFRRPAH